MARIHSKKLLVEGHTDKRVLPYLLEANGVTWEAAGEPIVYIEPCDGIDQMLKPGAIEAELGASGLEALGVMVDANGDARGQWTRVRDRCSGHFPSLPVEIPAEGLEIAHATGPRFGVWIMPDNRMKGALEDFLAQLVPIKSNSLFTFAEQCAAEAAKRGARFKPSHVTKATIHTWLAWQDEPGKSLHQAIDHRVLDPEKPESKPFVHWFRRLFLGGASTTSNFLEEPSTCSG